MKLAIVGSQSISRKQAETAWMIINGLVLVFEPETVISGGCTGVDSVAEAAVKEMGYTKVPPGISEPSISKRLWVFEPAVKRWDPVGQYGFKARNEDIARSCELLIRIAKKDGQQTYGSGWTAARAEELGRDVHRIYI